MNVNIKIQRNQIIISTEQQSKTFKASQSYSSPRLVVGDFDAAQNCLLDGAKSMGLVGFMKGKHDVRIEVNDYFGDGISSMERKIYRELASCIKMNKFEIELIREVVKD